MALSTRNARLRASTALTAVVLMATPALADFPGERWNISYVKVTGAASPTETNAVNQALSSANQTYFYGGTSARMDATVSGSSVNVRIIDQSTGQVMAERRGLPFGGDQEALTQTALAWMDSLDCGDGCQVAVVRQAPAPEVQVAAAPPTEPAETVPAPAAPSAPEAALPETPETAVPATPGAETPLIASAAAPSEPAAPLIVASIPTGQGASLQPSVAGAENPVSEIEAEIALPTTVARSAQPLGTPGVTAGRIPQAATPSAPPRTGAPTVAEPRTAGGASGLGDGTAVAAAPSAGGSAGAPITGAPAVSEPRSGSAAGLAAGAAAAAAQPAIGGGSAAPAVAAPQINVPAPPAAAPNRPAGTATGGGTQVATAPETSLQEVAPGVALPQPGTVAAPSPLGTADGTPASAQTGSGAPASRTELTLGEPTGASDAPRATGATSGAAPSAGGIEGQVATAPAAPVAEPSTGSVTTPQTSAGAAAAPAASSQTGAPIAAPATPAATPFVTVPSAPATAAPQIAAAPATGTQGQATATPAAPSPAQVAQSDGDGEQLALVNPASPEAAPARIEPRAVPTEPERQAAPEVTPEIVTPQPQTQAQPEEPSTTVETRVASVDPDAAGPTLANARWVGFTPAVFTGSEGRPGAWISGPFDRKERVGWITDTATGATTRVTFIWREAGSGGQAATLSRSAAQALGLNQGDVANVAVYLPR